MDKSGSLIWLPNDRTEYWKYSQQDSLDREPEHELPQETTGQCSLIFTRLDFDDLEFPVMKAVMEEALCSTVAAFQIQENSRNTKYWQD